ncbi:helix-turn-helix transcriptional regulator [Halopelagius fulvigenes]|uniref:Helix-turn-helix transcriptional regulator n=1 Tax=Halopelagius fulvigenes TaxID=1198324 RepID=A0ABD5U2E8_9EURY
MTVREDVAFLVGSESRVAILRSLRDASRRPTELADSCSCARETAQRTVSAFVERGWAEKVTDDGEYGLTPAGTMVANGYDDFESTVAVAGDLSVFLSHVGDVAVDLGPDVLRGLNATTATKGDPHAAVNRLLEVMGTEPPESFYGIAPIVSGIINEGAERIIGPESTVELIIDESVLEVSASEYPEALEAAYELDQFELYVSPEELDFGLLMVDNHVIFGAYDEMGNLVACVDGTDERFVSWAEDVYARYRAESRRAAEETSVSDSAAGDDA